MSPNSAPLILLPQPQSVVYHGGMLSLSDDKLIAIDNPGQLFTAERLQAALSDLGLHWEIVANSEALPINSLGARFRLVSEPNAQPDSYTLDIAADGILLSGSSLQAVWYGVCTLVQIVGQATDRQLPRLTITDWPDFARRGVMLDISRDKVPTMDTLYSLIDRLADWKINEVQLYTEHTFAYRQHPLVWANASPMTGEQIMQLDRFCRDRFIDLVPNQNSFGHMHRWLMHDRYRPMAEVPEGLNWAFFPTPRPFSLAPTDPRSLELIAGLYEELLPHFSSRYFNVGCDETLDLGLGRSRELVESQGRGRIYLDYLKKIAALVRSHGRVMQFWGDIIMEHPDLVPEIPKDVVALEWGYEANHPFDTNSACFADAGLQFYVCPGTSSWISLVGRTENAIGNLRNAAVNGKKHGARGYLITDWGDYGHWQPLPVSYLGFAYGAGLSWAIEANLEMDLPAVLSRFAFEDPTGIMGQWAYDLGNVYRTVDNYLQYNGVIMARALVAKLDDIRSQQAWLPRVQEPIAVNPAKVHAAMAEMDRLTARLPEAKPADALVVPEYRWAIRMWQHGCRRLLMANAESAPGMSEMAADLRPLIGEYPDRWLARNRPGGLGDSLTLIHRILAEYES